MPSRRDGGYSGRVSRLLGYNCAEAMAKIISTVIEEAVETIKEVNHTVMEKRGMIDTSSYFHPKGGHSNNIRPSSRNRHEAGERRRKNDQERSRRLNGKRRKGRSVWLPIDDDEDDGVAGDKQ